MAAFTVRDLREALEDLPDDMLVYVQVDAEGNGYKKCAGADPEGVLVDDSYHAEIYSAEWTADDACLDEEEWDQLLSEPRVLVIHPV